MPQKELVFSEKRNLFCKENYVKFGGLPKDSLEFISLRKRNVDLSKDLREPREDMPCSNEMS
jgi:hypothetical protein